MHVPGAGRRRGIDRQSQRIAAQTLVRNERALELDAVGPFDHERQRHIERGRALRVAQQRGEISRFAGTIDAPLGIDESIEPVRRRSARDAAVGQIESGRAQIEEGVIALRIGRGHQRGLRATLPVRQTRFEQRVAAGIGFPRRQNFIAARDQLELDAALGVGRRQRIDEDMNAIVAGERGQAEI